MIATVQQWKHVQTQTIDVDGVPFAFRELGPETGVPVVFLHHLMAVLDDWDPRIVDAIAARRRVITFDNRGVGRSGGVVPGTVEEMGEMPLSSSERWASNRSTCSGSPSAAGWPRWSRSRRPTSCDG